MPDSDLAEIYKCANGTKTINLAVKRNSDRFPNDFYFQLNEEEFSKICGFNLKPQKSKIRSLPYVFTEQGVAMLATVIRTEIAAQVSINIMRAFVNMRHYLKATYDILPNRVLSLEEKVDDNTKRINELFDKFEPKEILKDRIIYKGGVFDSHLILLDIFDYANEEIIIIDNYAGKELLKIIKDIKKKIIIVSFNIDKILKEKYEKQYNNVKFIINSTYHDFTFNPDTKEYNVLVGENENSIEIAVVPNDSKATVSINGNTNLKPGLNKVSIKVTSEKGDVNEYAFNVYKIGEETEKEKEDNITPPSKNEKKKGFNIWLIIAIIEFLGLLVLSLLLFKKTRQNMKEESILVLDNDSQKLEDDSELSSNDSSEDFSNSQEIDYSTSNSNDDSSFNNDDTIEESKSPSIR